MSEPKDKKKARRKGSGSSLADAVVAALAQVEQKDSGAPPAPKPTPAPAPVRDEPKWNDPPAPSAPLPIVEPAAPAVAAPAAVVSGPAPAAAVEAVAPVVAAVVQRTVAVAPGESDDPVLTSKAEPVAASQPSEPPPPADAPVAEPAVEKQEAPTDPPTTKRPVTPIETLSTGKGVRVRYYGRTDVGLVREHNEDNFMVADLTAKRRGVDQAILETTVQDHGCVFTVCDGMGGAAAGEVASQMAVDTIHEILQAGGAPKDRDGFARRLVRSIEEAGARIFAAAKMDRSRRGMGTTSTVAGLVDKTLFVGQVGDSRAYVLRGDQFALISKDQSLVNQLIEAGQLTEEEAEAFEHSNIILQALGTTEEVAVDLTFLELRKGDRLLLCSDGLSGLVHGEMIKEVLQGQKDLVDAATQLIAMANAGGGHDNITVVLVDFDGEDLKESSSDARVAYQQYPLPPEAKTDEPTSPRQVKIKSGGPKPGADVKGGADPRPSPSSSEPEGRSWVPFLLLGALVLLVVAAVLFASSGSGSAPPDGPPSSATPTRAAVVSAPAAPARASVTLSTWEPTGEAAATLWVNDRIDGVASDGRVLDLAPGVYHLRATAGASPGAPLVAEATVTLEAGGHATADLSPTELADPGDEVALAPAGAPTEAAPAPAP